MYECKHENIIRLFNHYEDQSNVYLLMEYASGGCLRDKFQEKKRLDEKTVLNYISQIIKGV